MFQLTEEQQDLCTSVQRYAREVLFPRAAEVETTGEEFPADILADMGQLGLIGLDIPKEYGGPGLNTFTAGLVSEEVAYHWWSASSYTVSLATGPLLKVGSEEIKRRYLPAICQGKLVTAFGLTEPTSGSDAAAMKTTAVRDGGDYVLNGTKIFITNAHRAGIITLFAKTGEDASKRPRISLFLIEKGHKGLNIGQRFRTLGHAANPIWEVILDDCRVPAGSLLGEEGDAFDHIQADLAKVRALYGVRCAGFAQGAIDYAIRYAQERSIFSRPVADFQGNRFKIADIVTKIEAARRLSYSAAALADQGHQDANVAASMAKHFSSGVAVEATGEAVQLMGGHGLIQDHPVERYYREAKLFQIGDGSSEVMRVLISRHANSRIRSSGTARFAST